MPVSQSKYGLETAEKPCEKEAPLEEDSVKYRGSESSISKSITKMRMYATDSPSRLETSRLGASDEKNAVQI